MSMNELICKIKTMPGMHVAMKYECTPSSQFQQVRCQSVLQFMTQHGMIAENLGTSKTPAGFLVAAGEVTNVRFSEFGIAVLTQIANEPGLRFSIPVR